MTARRIFVAGFQHETNTFAPSKADWAAFEAGSGWPAVSRGAAMLDRLGGTSLPMGGFVRAARSRDHHLVPSIWAGATPSAHVTEHAFERIAAAVVEDLRRAVDGGADGIHGVYLDLHGAAVAEHVDDCEGELLERVRAVVGPRCPVVASLDLHANLSERMVRLADALVAYREYPHVDMAATGERALGLLEHLLDGGALHRHAERVPFLLPLNAQCTLLEPARTVMARLAGIEQQHGVTLSLALGFPAADIPDCGPVAYGCGTDAAAVRRAVQALRAEVVDRRAEWALELKPPREAVAEAMALAVGAERAVVVADTQDNPGAGGDANTTGLLHALLEAGAGRRWPQRVALGLLHDPAAAAAAHAAGIGATLELALGRAVPTFDGRLSEPPLVARVVVRALHAGTLTLHGPMTAGATATLGPCARLDVDGIQVLVASAKAQMLDLDLVRFLGVEPQAMKLLVVKSSVHFRAAFAPVASHIRVAKAAGPMAADPADLPWRRLPPSVDRRP